MPSAYPAVCGIEREAINNENKKKSMCICSRPVMAMLSIKWLIEQCSLFYTVGTLDLKAKLRLKYIYINQL